MKRKSVSICEINRRILKIKDRYETEKKRGALELADRVWHIWLGLELAKRKYMPRDLWLKEGEGVKQMYCPTCKQVHYIENKGW